MPTTLNYTPRDVTNYLVVHCSATKPHMDIGEAEIREWHIQKGWADIGYNVVIRRDGRVEIGRPLDYRGAHVKGHNFDSVGVCLVGGLDADGNPAPEYTPTQWISLKTTLDFLKTIWPEAEIVGHRDLIAPGDTPKACPSFDVKTWLSSLK